MFPKALRPLANGNAPSLVTVPNAEAVAARTQRSIYFSPFPLHNSVARPWKNLKRHQIAIFTYGSLDVVRWQTRSSQS